MTSFTSTHHQPWLRYVVLPFLLIIFGLISSNLYLGQNPSSAQAPAAPTTAAY